MRRWIGFLLGLLGLPSLAFAGCAGSDRLAALAAENPAAHAEIVSGAARVPNGQGIFWRVERPGAVPSHLFGTFHDTELAEAPLGAAVATALDGARVLLVEITDREQARLQQRIATDPAFALDLDGPGISARLDPGDRALAEAQLARRGLSLELIDPMRPAFLMSILAMPQCAIEEMAAGKPVLDAALVARAAAAGIPVIGMEDYMEAIARIDALPADVLDALLTETLLNLDEQEDYRRTSVALYRRGEMAMMQEYTIWTGAEEFGLAESRRLYAVFSESLVAERNRAWLETLVPELEAGGVFAAFGALHLPGEDGVIELLRARGFTVTRADG